MYTGREERKPSAHAKAGDTEGVALHSALLLQVLDRPAQVSHGPVVRQGVGKSEDFLHIPVGDHPLFLRVIQVRCQGHVASLGKAAGEVLDVLIEAEGFKNH